MIPPLGSTSAQGHELQIATNCLGPYLFTKLLTPVLQQTAALSDTAVGSVRVTWAASLGVEVISPKPGGMILLPNGNFVPDKEDNQKNYGASKVGNVFLATEFARRHKDSGVVSNAWNPGNLKTELQRHSGTLLLMMTSWMLYSAVYGAYTELFAGCSDEAGRKEANGGYVWPWGR